MEMSTAIGFSSSAKGFSKSSLCNSLPMLDLMWQATLSVISWVAECRCKGEHHNPTHNMPTHCTPQTITDSSNIAQLGFPVFNQVSSMTLVTDMVISRPL